MLAWSVVAAPASAGEFALSADEARVTYSGEVVAVDGAPLPTRVRAVAEDGTICGSTRVEPASERQGSYELHVATAGEKPGCPDVGDDFFFRLIDGKIDDGVSGSDRATLALGTHELHLFAGEEAQSGRFAGSPPPAGGISLMRWHGPGGVPVASAAATLPVDVAGIFQYDRATETWRAWVRGGPDFMQTYDTIAADDIVLVRGSPHP